MITTIDRLDAPFVALEGGEYGWGRLAGGGTADLDDDSRITGMAEYKTYDGPWELPEDLEHYFAVGQVPAPTRTSARWV